MQRARLPIVMTLGLLSLSSVGGYPAQTDFPPEEQNWQAVCKAALAEPLPAAAAQLAEAARREQDAPRHCDEETAYYGFARAPDYAEARRCAYLQRAKPEMAIGSFVDGPGTLAMLYANGYGVPRDYSLAIRFSCELSDLGAAQAETQMRIGRLEALRDGKFTQKAPFNLCDDATSGAMGAYCQDVTERLADVGRAQRLKTLRAKLPAAAQAMLPKLQAAESAFEKARGKGEDTGGGGSGSAGFEELDQGQLREQFLINMRRFAAGDLPNATASDRARAEQQMQAAFAAAEEKAQPSGSPNRNLGAPDPDKASIARTQHTWESLFAAWMRFVPVAYPHLSPDTAATELLRLRIHQLRRVY